MFDATFTDAPGVGTHTYSLQMRTQDPNTLCTAYRGDGVGAAAFAARAELLRWFDPLNSLQYSGSVAFRAARSAAFHAVFWQVLSQNLRCLFRFFGRGTPQFWQAQAE